MSAKRANHASVACMTSSVIPNYIQESDHIFVQNVGVALHVETLWHATTRGLAVAQDDGPVWVVLPAATMNTKAMGQVEGKTPWKD